MPRRVTNWLFVLCVLCAVSFTCPSETRAHGAELAAAETHAAPPALHERQVLAPGRQAERMAPRKAYDLLDALQRRHGTPLPGYHGGQHFQNRERRLPRGRYKEYDVNRRVPGRSRDAERLVIEQHSGKAYYTDDHYRTFIPLN
jgi:ribonuclease T1